MKTEKIREDILPRKTVEKMLKDRLVRTAITRQSHYLFFHFYFAHYVKYETAPFHREIFYLTEEASLKNLFIVAFRGSGKSTIVTLSYPIWAILGEQQKKFVLILCQTRNQAKQHMMNLKRELESNALLRNDLGPFQEERGEWGSSSLVFTRLNARITAASTEQSIRGLRHDQYRPDLLIGDDVEDLNSARTLEAREKTYQWLTGEVIPAGDRNTRLVIVGNLLHYNSLLMHLKEDMDNGKIQGVFRSYPLLTEKNEILWPGKYPTWQDIEEEKKKVGSEVSWQREYLLRIIPDDFQVIYPEWLHAYAELPTKGLRKIFIGVDLAISEKETADYTAIVVGFIYGYEKKFRVRILPHSINRKMSFPETLEQLQALYQSLKHYGVSVKVLVEDVGYQRAVAQQLANTGYKAEGVKVAGDKRSRLMTVSNLIKSGKILFPAKGAEDLVRQILGFGIDRHDDLVDAFTIIAHKAIEMDKSGPRIWFIGGGGCDEVKLWDDNYDENIGLSGGFSKPLD